MSPATAHLNLSQTAVSHRMRKLEEELGLKLLARTTREVTLTRAGIDFLPKARKALSELEQSFDDLRQQGAKRRERLDVACLPVFAVNYMPPILRRFGFRRVLIWNSFLVAGSFMLCTLFRPTTPLWMIAAVLTVGGFFRFLQFTSMNTLVYAEIEQEDMSQASTSAAMAQQMMLTAGVGFSALLLHTIQSIRGDAHLVWQDVSPAFVASLTDGMPRSANVTAYAATVREKWLKRSVLAEAEQLIRDAQADIASGEALLEQAEAAVHAADEALTTAEQALNEARRRLQTHSDDLPFAVGAIPENYGLLPATDLLNLNLNWRGIAGSPIDAALFATNVTNEKYRVASSGGLPSTGGEFILVGEPRMYGVRVRYRFGE